MEGHVSAVARELQEIFENLKDRRVRQRKEGLDRLDAVLAKDVNLAILDSLTFGVGAENTQDAYACKYATWVAILEILTDNVQEDVEKALKRNQVPQSMFSRPVRAVVKKAISKRSSATANVLEPCAVHLMDHLSFVMSTTFMHRQDSQIYNDYAMTLKFLLDNGDYMVFLGPDVFQRILVPLTDMIHGNIDSFKDNNKISSFMGRDLTMLRAILLHSDYDMSEEMMQSLLSLLLQFGENDRMKDVAAKLCYDVIGLCVQVMLCTKGDSKSELSTILNGFYHFCLLLLRKGNPEGREVAFQFFRIGLKLDILTNDHVLDLWCWYQGLELEDVWQQAPESSDYTFNHMQSCRASLLGAIETWGHERSIDLSGISAEKNVRGGALRRAGVDLVTDSLKHPSSLGPVACVFVKQRGQFVKVHDFDSMCMMVHEKVREMFQHSFASEQVKPDVVWILRLVYTLIESALKRPDSNVSPHLGKTISLLIQQYKALSNHKVTRDLIKMIIITALPEMHDFIRIHSVDSFKQALLSESPSPISVILYTLLIRYKKFIGYGQTDTMLSCNWILESIDFGAPSHIASAALCTVVFGGNKTNLVNLQNYISNLQMDISWAKTEKIDHLIDSLPPVSRWALHEELMSSESHSVTHQIAEPVKSTCDINNYVSEKIRVALESKCSTGVDQSYLFAAMGIEMLCHAIDDQQGFECWSFNSGYCATLINSIKNCIRNIKEEVLICGNLNKARVQSIKCFSDAVALIGSSKYVEFHHHLRDALDEFPSLFVAFNTSMRLKDFSGSDLEQEGLDNSQLGNNAMQGMIVSRGISPAGRRVPMLQWYLNIYQSINILDVSHALQKIYQCLGKFYETNYFLPLAIRNQLTFAEFGCLCTMLKQGQVPDELQAVQFLQLTKGTYTYDDVLLFRPGILEDVLSNAYQLILEAQNLAIQEDAEIAISCISDQMTIILESAIDTKSVSQRIYLGNLVIGLLDVDSGLLRSSSSEPLVESLAVLITDRYPARIEASKLFPRLLEFYDDPSLLFNLLMGSLPLECNENSEKTIDYESGKGEFLGTIMIALGRVALKIPSLELVCISMLVQEFSEDNNHINAIILDTLLWVANSLGYDSAKDYLLAMSRSILVHMMSNSKRAIFCMGKYFLACKKLGLENLPEKEILLAFLIHHSSRDGVKWLLKYLGGEDFYGLLVASRGEICAVNLYLTDLDEMEGFYLNVMNNIGRMASLLDTNLDMDKITSDLSEDIIINIIGHGWECEETSDDSDGIFSKDVLMIAELAHRIAKVGKSTLRQVDAVELLLQVQQKIFAFRHPRHKIQALKATKCSILYLQDYFCIPGVLRQILAILKILIRLPTTCEAASGIMLYVVDKVLQEEKGSEDFQALVEIIQKSTPLIISYICDTYSNSSPPDDSAAMGCILFLTCDAPDALKEGSYIVDPRIESISKDKALSEYFSQKLRSNSLRQCIDEFAEIVGMVSESTRQRYIKMFRQLIRRSIYARTNSEPFITERSLWKIVLASASHDNDKALMDFAGELVASFGPLGPRVLSFRPTEYSHTINNKDTSRRENCLDKLKNDVFCECLVLLSEYLVEEDALVASEAFIILQEILSIPEGSAALNRLDPSLQAYLGVFILSKVIDIDQESERRVAKPSAALWELDGSDYDTWITRIGHDILLKSNDEVLTNCANLAKMRANFAEVLLPLAFVQMSELSISETDGIDLGTFLGALITRNVLPFFEKYPKAANVVLKTLHVMRQIYNDAAEQALKSNDRPPPVSWETMYWLKIDYLVLTKACIDCRSLYSALIFAEMWKETKYDSAGHAEHRKYESLIQEIYSLLPEPDGLYAVSRSNDALSQLRRFEREGDWARAMVIDDLAIQLNEGKNSVFNIPEHEALNSLRRCLGNLGSSFLLSAVAKYKQKRDFAGGDAISQAAIALGEWYPMESSNDPLVSEATDPYLAAAMQHFQIGYSEGFIDSIQNVRNEVIHLLASASRETTADLNPLIVRAQMAQNISEAWGLKWGELDTFHSSESTMDRMNVNLRDTVELWKEREHIAGAGWRFSLDIPLKDLRYNLLETLKKDELKAECLLDIAICARKADRNGQAFAALARFRQCIASVRDPWVAIHRPPESSWRVEEAKTLWAQNQHDAAIMTLGSCSIQATRSESNVVDLAYLKCILAKWLALKQRESSSDILASLKENAYSLADFDAFSHPSHSKKVCRAYYRLASYANQLSNEIANKKLSVEWMRSKSILDKKISEQASLKAQIHSKKKKRGRHDELSGSVKQLEGSLGKLEATIAEDSKAMNSADQKQRDYEILAVKGYSSSLKYGSHYDVPAMFRLVDIWLSNTSNDGEAINRCFGENAGDIPSYKLIPLAYQLASRLNSSDQGNSTEFQSNLTSLLFRMAKDHPFQILPILFALKNGDKTGSYGALVYEANTSRIEAAIDLIEGIRSLDDRMASIIYEMEVATQGYIKLARIPVERSEQSMAFPAACRRQFCRELKTIPVLSVLLPLDYSLKYENIPTIDTIDENITFPGGINKPKLVTIIDSHGTKRRQLVKGGRDDLRQDAVMQQFFRICNAFLRESKSTASRNLSIQTYFALPFSPSSGLLEWIDNTDSLGKFITDGNIQYRRAAHGVLRKLEEFNNTGNESIKVKKKMFDECIRTLGKPRMRKVFARRYPDPGTWFEARLSYTRSVAVNSMAGHIIGLGDRHLTNILISKENAEVIHIDLGIAFEQGKFLPTPERVPFRLTRNMVDGMGVTGVEGVMRRCCEETMRVLRKHKDPILTVLSVFIHDPLYNWALTHEIASKKQADDSTMEDDYTKTMGDLEGNLDANRTLLQIQHKLEGIVGGDTTSRGVEGQVQYLMSEAMEPLNLCRMYRGWQSHI